ncbi:MAG: zinc/iron-chelating domain-containing protein [Desulfobacteraceae bacterium 4572_19]|nr:MAG: zinc/iron-chelating domain-containing protein [Desulfobacteraceae bacterium 4572_19]
MSVDNLSASDIFKCKQCGECCTGYGGTYVTDKDINAIANYTNISSKKILSDFCSISGTKPLLAVGESGKCIFFNKLCTIHPVKPYMCRAWPFIKNVIVDPENWNIMANSCPGIKKDIPHDILCKIVKTQIDLQHKTMSP